MVESIDTGLHQAPADENESAGQTDSHTSLSKCLVIVGWIGMIVFAFHASTHMVAAGDTWVAMACGRHFVNHGVDTIEPFSANSHKPGPTEEEIKTWPNWAQSLANTVGLETVKKWHPTGWINQNWLTHVIFYKLTTGLGSEEDPYFDALVYGKYLLYFLTVICVYAIARIQGVYPLLAAGFAGFAMFVGRSFLDIRPAGFSNFLVSLFVLILVMTQYRHVLYIWLIVPLSVFWCNVHGGYIYVFIMLMPFFVMNVLSLPFKGWVEGVGIKGLYHTVSAGLVSLICVILFNPFHLTNLTHTYVISFSKHAERWREIYEWHPAFEWSNPVGTAVPFLILFIMVWLLILVWPVIRFWSYVTLLGTDGQDSRKQRGKVKRQRAKLKRQHVQPPSIETVSEASYSLPRLNPALLAIAVLTIYMAYRSRRFIPIAAFVGCPFVAVLIQQVINTVTATFQYKKNNRFLCTALGTQWQKALLLISTVGVVGFGLWTWSTYRRIYLSPWPADVNRHSVFMRMTASFLKPFEACQFIRQNKLSGKMMNYWTEGGCIAWGQTPDPNTGKPPLQLFMDGRAQAAYDRQIFDLWNALWNGGEYGVQILRNPAEASADDYKKTGEWISKALRDRQVWAALIPQGQFAKPFCRSLEHLPGEWPLVYQDGKQKLFVDAQSEQGRDLFVGIKTGTTLYPNEFIRNLNLAQYYLIYDQDDGAKQKGLDYAIKAFEIEASQAVMLQILGQAARYRPLWDQINAFCQALVDDFDKNKETYKRQHGYQERIASVRFACQHLARYLELQKRIEDRDIYLSISEIYKHEIENIVTVMRW